ncbi:CPBP family intramembrane metalloprotease [Flavobacterium johnsoniae]|uniref:CPBP family intramembrane glutamic endopeptidase n=1 Tax=Flavobacterium johnsoniae TaxID=986 RepID=UPI0025B021D3|nr:CPBP family intramembrane glutamic endopeptidase [Flavobacterium johnsoniae]WJS94595.1 CPBP family intramembrane metalloprotease [Flavobacterium johnsoniae]
MKKIISFYIKAFLQISFISIPFIFLAFPDLNKNEFTYKIWICSFFPQLVYIIYLFKKNNLYGSFKTALFYKSFDFRAYVFSFFLPFTIYCSLIGLELIRISKEFHWDIDILFFFIMIFFSALLEEILFRFIPYSFLSNEFTLKKILLISLFFSVFHLFNPNITIIGAVNIILAGVFFSLIYLKSNSLFLVTVIHAFWNFTIGCLLGSNISGMKIKSILKYNAQKPFIWSGGEFGFEGSIITTIFFLGTSIFLYNLKTSRIFNY